MKLFKYEGRLLEEQGADGTNNGGGAAAMPSAEELSKMVNQAVTSQLGRMLPKALEGVTSAIGKTLDERLAAAKPVVTETTQQTTNQPSPELVALQRQIAELTAANKASEDRARAVEQRSREDAAFGELRTALGTHLKPEFIDPIAKSLYYADKRVEFGEDGRPLFRALVPQYTGGPLQETLLPLRDGVEAFAKSKEAEAFRPPPSPKTPQAAPPRLPSSVNSGAPAFGNKIPTAAEDPGWATRMEAELVAQGVPNGSL
jgi:hypothetical protein